MTSYDRIRGAAQGVALNWRDARRGGNDQVITDRLRRSLDLLVAEFERQAARRLGELHAHQAVEHSDLWPPS